MEEKPNYYAVIPSEVRYDEHLKDKAKLLYGEITALATKSGCCYASNKYFAELYHVSTTTISLLIKNLIERGYITSEIIYKEGTKEILNRYLRIVKEGYLKNLKEGIYENLKDNNTSINNTSINNKEIYKEIIDYLNITTNKHYKHTDSTIKLIKARLNEGFTVSDFKEVIDKKTKDWGEDQRMKDYLRPQTLFSNKFEGYLNQEEKKKSGFMGYMEEFYGKENNS